MIESPENARNKAEVGWGDFIIILEHHGDKNGCHVVQVNPRGTTKECASCGVETRKPLWVREHSCPACGLGSHLTGTEEGLECGAERPLSGTRETRSGSESLRSNACGDCDRCVHHRWRFFVHRRDYKSRHRNRKPRPQASTA
ncbi:MAG: transposase [Haloquadratum walsbyi J07HQW2]|uniref:Transposase n=1 Tax=Haloquadratum walsbyi J07HQW2 TaxID=1238425 RepID=U1NBW3_9EURY|nr:MAG: transposase [Haloquadratum walsbyi J07HQW2]